MATVAPDTEPLSGSILMVFAAHWVAFNFDLFIGLRIPMQEIESRKMFTVHQEDLSK